jgi:hypothetical protein
MQDRPGTPAGVEIENPQKLQLQAFLHGPLRRQDRPLHLLPVHRRIRLLRHQYYRLPKIQQLQHPRLLRLVLS